MKRTLSTFILSLITLIVLAQENTHNSSQWEKYLEDLNGQEEFESVDWDSYYDYLSELAEHPLNINTIRKDDLDKMPFLSATQIEDILAYLYQYGEMKSQGELTMIRSLDYTQCQLLRIFTYVGDVSKSVYYPSLKDIIKYGKQEVIATAKVPFYSRKGDDDGYLGSKYKQWIRYNFSMGQYLRFGIMCSQDAGEPFFSDRNKYGYDYYSFWFQIKKMGRLKNLTLGRYRLRFGMGLVMNNDFGLGKIATLSTMGRSYSNISAHSSRSSANYMQGVAVCYSLTKDIDFTVFASYRKIDATLNKDSDNTIATIVNTGYHRTKTEMDKKDNASEFVSGGNINFFKNGFHLGFVGYYSSFNKDIRPKISQIYRKWYASGNDFYNVSAYYGYISHRLNISGETATGNSHAVATINSVSYLLTNELSVMALQRYYGCKYYSLYSNSFSDGGSVQDENGIYMGLNWNPSRTFSLSAYTDYAYFAWPKYGHTQSSSSWDSMLSAFWNSSQWHLKARYRIKMKDTEVKNNTGEVSEILFKGEQRGEVSVAYEEESFTGKTQVNVCYSELKGSDFGWMINENISKKWKMINASLSFGYFKTSNYNSRVYMYEQGVLYNMNFPMFYGHGIRYSANVRTDIGKHIMMIVKLATTDYFDRNHISESYQQINHSSQTDLDIQMRIKF